MKRRKLYIVMIALAVIVTAGTSILAFMILSDQNEANHTNIEQTNMSPALENEEETSPIETPEPTYPEEDCQPDEYPQLEEPLPERVLPELSEGLIRWHIYPTWNFDQVFNFSEGMAGVEYFEIPGIWDSLHTLGYMNRYGEIIIPIDHVHEAFHYGYMGAPPFIDGRLALMCQNRGGVGVYSIEGNLIVPFNFHGGWAFSHGLLAVHRSYPTELGLSYNRAGFIDREGNVVIPFEFDEAMPFSEGRAAVKRDGYWGFIDTAGEVVIPFIIQPAYDDGHGWPIIPRFSNGLVAVSTGERGTNEYGEWVDNVHWGFMDREGNMAIPFQFTDVRNFSNGLASVGIGYESIWGNRTVWGKIDIVGNIILPFEYVALHPYIGGAIYALCMASTSRLYDGNGNIIIPSGRYGDIHLINEERVAVRTIGSWNDTVWGFVDIQGNEIIPPQFDAVEQFTQGFAPVRMGGWETTHDGNRVDNSRWGLIDLEGNIVVPIEFDEVRNFSEGLAWVRFEGYWGLIKIVEE